MAIPSISGTSEEWQRVAVAVAGRRHELGYTVAEICGSVENRISDATWSKLESGRGPSMSRRALNVASRALGWSSDSIERILAGQEPEPMHGNHDNERVESNFRAWATEKELRETLLRLTDSEESIARLEDRLQRIEALIQELAAAVVDLPDET